ncbi:succinyl-CoA:acetate CoA-transferase [Aequitasia blattaphilus]|uniref:Succinate CoA transferase n=1 Tax=Aequitasia blattaphilus TaxID=2949332 RepID=A0ABT1EA53_9FIRM|nr:succinate CoA transferase [Aequitasia blattaphilus]MCP1102678.1 succinate CoA transferase [Aequitasia blattaphilus]MCR8615318.1 succinate CoA transferase [Aequitasia blattaphilus]
MNENFTKRIRNKDLLDKVMSADEAAKFINPGMTLGVSGFTIAGYPKKIGASLAKRADAGEKLDLTVYSGASLGDEFDGELTRKGVFKKRIPYQTNTDLRNAINAGKVGYFDMALSELPLWVKNGVLNPIDVAIVEAAAIDEEGNIIPTTSIGVSNTYVEYADKVIIELNTYVPEAIEGIHDVFSPKKVPNTEPIMITKPSDRIGTTYIKCDPSKIVAIIESDIPDNGRSVAAPDDEFRQMANNLIGFLKSEVDAGRLCNPLPPLQAGIGSVTNAVLDGLQASDFQHMTVYSEVLQNSIFELMDSGKIDFACATSLTLSADVRDKFFENFEKYKDKIMLRPQEISNSPEVIRRLGIIAINTVIEADIYGNTNSTYIDGHRLMNGVGGSGDYCQNAGLAIFITKSTAKNGNLSSIVPLVSHIDHTIHETHVIITEQGVADLRGLDPIDRANTIIDNCAHPDFRPALHAYLEEAQESCCNKHKPVNLKAAVEFNKTK